jgi:hypothetical protein
MDMQLACGENRNAYNPDGENILPKLPLPRPIRKVKNIKTIYFFQ